MSNPMENKWSTYAPAVVSVITFLVYFTTMSRGVMPIDSGELAASQYTLGISHPSGYPLFNLIGYLWSKIPIGSVIFRLNLLCAIWVALANFFLIKTALIVLYHFLPSVVYVKGPKKNKPIAIKQEFHPFPALVSAISGVLMIAFCKTWWVQSAGVEVYSLQM